MFELLMPWLAALFYFCATALLARQLRDEANQSRTALWLIGPALVMHLASHSLGWVRLNGPDLHFFAALSLVSLAMAIFSAAASGTNGVKTLGVVVYPLAALFLILYHVAGHGHAEALDWRLQLHAWLALLAYASLAIATLIAIMLWFQERALRQRQLHGWLRTLPPLIQLEALLFRTLSASFGLLTLALVTGVVFVDNLLAQHLWHKTVLSVLSWAVLATLLFGRQRFGWRGPRAASLTLTAMALLALAFFGSKFVLELMLHRY